ncbi:MAG: hypothetical protein GX303_01360 [Clostridiales bacterium]|nr:hypothetical protein [Clostridiales bacterium]
MMKSNAKYLGLGSVITGTFFLFNPNINILDILPDFIGYIFIITGISAVADINMHLSEARQRFLKLIYINLSRIPAFFIMMRIVSSAIDEQTTVLVLTFAYAVVELIYLPGAFSELFEGLTYLGSRYDSGSVFRLPKGRADARKSKPVSRLKYYTFFFMFAKLLLPCVPYLMYLRIDNPYGIIDPSSYALERYKNPLIIITAFIVLVLGVIWLYRFVRYFRNVLRDKPFIDKITEAYKNQVVSREGFIIKRKINSITIIFCIAFGLAPDLFVSDVNLLPDAASALFFFIGALMLVKYTASAKPVIPLSALYFLSSLATYSTSIYFIDNFAYEVLEKSEEARVAYRILTALTIVEAAILCVLLFFIARAFSDLAHRHTGYEGDNINHLSDSQSMSVAKLLSRRLYISFGYGVAAAIGSILYVILKARTYSVFIQNPYIEPTYAYYPEIELLWLYYLLLSLVWALYTIRVLRQISKETEQKYKYS